MALYYVRIFIRQKGANISTGQKANILLHQAGLLNPHQKRDLNGVDITLCLMGLTISEKRLEILLMVLMPEELDMHMRK